MGRRKPFIDKKHAITFKLVHRSQRDPLQANEDASSRVLVPSEANQVEKRKEDQRKFGVFYDDDYNYMQHLYDLNEVHGVESEPTRWSHDVVVLNESDEEEEEVILHLPSSVLPSVMERDVGLLNQAIPITGPQPSWDPDIVAAMDDDFDMDDPDNILEDDFLLKANAPSADSDENMDEDNEDWNDGLSDVSADTDERSFSGEETKSLFTDYSLSSAVIPRNNELTQLDERFEKLYEQYTESDIGALDSDDIDGAVTSDDLLMQDVLSNFKVYQERRSKNHQLGTIEENPGADLECDKESDEDLEKLVVERIDEKWDCESILSTYSNIYNHPTLIKGPEKEKKIDLTSKLGLPRESLPPVGLTHRQIEKQIRQDRMADRASTYRPHHESRDERKLRKQAIKNERKERRIEKKSNKLAFHEEELKQKKQQTSSLVGNMQAVKIS